MIAIEFLEDENLFKIATKDWKYSYPKENMNVPKGTFTVYFNRISGTVLFQNNSEKDITFYYNTIENNLLIDYIILHN